VAAAGYVVEMPDPDHRPPPGVWPIAWEVLLEGLCAYHHAQHPSALTIAPSKDLQDRRLQPNRDAASLDRPVKCPSGRLRARSWRLDVHHRIMEFLRAPAIEWLARALLTLPFWSSGLSKLILFDSGVAEMARAGLNPPAAFNVATIVVQLLGSALIVVNRAAWLGAGALGLFTALTILLVHRFWAIAEEPFRTIALHVSIEHLGMIGGLLAIAILSARRRITSDTPNTYSFYA
jgi:transmembrane protein